MRIEEIIKRGESSNDKDLIESIFQELIEIVTVTGIPPPQFIDGHVEESHLLLRAKLWKILLKVTKIDDDMVNEYQRLVELGPSREMRTIKVDAPRTLLRTIVKNRVSPDQLIRSLNAWQHSVGYEFSYCQGFNNIMATLLFIMPEVDAFYCFSKLLLEYVPSYAKEKIPGAFQALKLIREILFRIDPTFAKEFYDKCKQSPPLLEFIIPFNITNDPPSKEGETESRGDLFLEIFPLWDVALCLGFHVHLVFSAARILLLRDKIITSDNPNKLFSPDLPPLESKKILVLALPILYALPEEVEEELIKHCLYIEELPSRQT